MPSIRETCEKRLVGLKAMRQPIEADCEEIARFAAPRSIRIQSSDTNRRKTRKGSTIFDAHGIKSFRTLTGGMTSGLSSESRPWFSLALHDEDLMENAEVAEWLDVVEKRIAMFLGGTNFYGAAKVGYSQMGMFGTEACVMDEHWRLGAVCHPLLFGQYWIARNEARQVDTLYRSCPLTAKQAVEQFKGSVSPRVQMAYDTSNYEAMVDVMQAIEPNPNFEFGKLDRSGKAWRSVYWDREDGRHDALLRQSGYNEQPFWAPSWDDPGPDVWSSSPGFDVLPDLRELQMQAKRKGEATDWVINPEKVAPATVKLRNRPGNIVTAANVDKDTVQVPYQLPYQAIGVIAEDIQRMQQKVDEGTFADLFMAITNMPGVQPRNIEEIAARNEEKLTQLGPVVTNVNRDKLQIALDRVFGIMLRGKMLPPAPDAIQEQELRVNFISILTQMQRSIGVGQVQETVGFVGNLAAVNPEVLDKVDWDAAIDEFADRKGAPQRIIRSTKDAEKIRSDRAQAQQQQKMMEQMPNMQKGADAARLLAETAQNVQAPMA
jgi:hypothetical protein